MLDGPAAPLEETAMRNLFKFFTKKKRSIRPIALVTAVPIVAAVTPVPAVVPDKGEHTLNFGVYDPEGRCQQKNSIAIEHLFVSWAIYQPGELLRQLETIRSKGRGAFVTIEPWIDRTITSLPSALLDDVTQGKYDRRIEQFALEIAAFRSLVLLRWGHEMENVTGRYPLSKSLSTFCHDLSAQRQQHSLCLVARRRQRVSPLLARRAVCGLCRAICV